MERPLSTLDLPAVVVPTATVPLVQDYEPSATHLWKSASAHHIVRRVNSRLELPPRPPPGTSRSYRDSQIDTIHPIFEHTVLDRTQREAYYSTLARILGPAEGIQEGVGSYKVHMERQMAIYYERILPGYSLSTSAECGQLGTSANVDTYPELTEPSDDLTSVMELGHLSDDCASDSTSCSMSVDTTTCSSSDSSAWQPKNLATLVSGAFSGSYDLADTETVQSQPFNQPLVQQPRSKTVSFGLNNYSDAFLPTCSFSQFAGPIFNSSSSSLAGALDELPCPSADMVQETRRKSKDWPRPRMGRTRAYSGGGGM